MIMAEEFYTPDEDLYTRLIESYTSDSEFRLARRAHITNEVPTIDIFESLHSVMANDVWKWFVGSNSVTFNVPFNESTNGWEYVSDGAYVEISNAKYVNGVRVADYGPQPEWVGGKKWVPNGVRYEVNGSLLPDFDLLLHEGYRYLEKAFPDHPDWIDLLTRREINDQIVDAGQVIDYTPNVVLFDEIARALRYDIEKNPKTKPEELQRARELESIKLKIRNLTNHAYRRKFYGSKSGYRMFGKDALQNVNVYKVSRYIPYKPLYPEDLDQTHTKSFEWFMNETDNPDFDDRVANRFNRNYERSFRLLDWYSSSYELIDPPPVVTIATGFSTEYDKWGLYEYRRIGDRLIPTKFPGFKINQEIDVNGQVCRIETMRDLDAEETRVVITEEDMFVETTPRPLFVHRLGLFDQPTVTLDPLLMYGTIDAALDEASADNRKKYTDKVAELDYVGSIKRFAALIEKPMELPVTMDPFREGSFIPKYGIQARAWSELNWAVTIEENVATMNFTKDEVSPECPVKQGTILSLKPIDDTTTDDVIEVVKITKGKMVFERLENMKPYVAEAKELEKFQKGEEIGVVIDMSEPVLVIGRPHFDIVGPDDFDQYEVRNLSIDVTSIPKVKSRYVLWRLYPDYLDACTDKWNALLKAFPKLDILEEKNAFRKAVEKRVIVEERWEILRDNLGDIVSNPPVKKSDSRVSSLKSQSRNFASSLPSKVGKLILNTAYDEWALTRDWVNDNERTLEGLIEFQTLATDMMTQTILDFEASIMEIEKRVWYEEVEQKRVSPEIWEQLEIVKAIDLKWDPRRANRWLTLKPVPQTPWKPMLGVKDVGPLVNGASCMFNELLHHVDKFFSIVQSPVMGENVDFKLEPYIGTSAYLKDYDPTVIDTVLMIDEGVEVGVPKDDFDEPFIKLIGDYLTVRQHTIDSKVYDVLDINTSLFDAMNSVHTGDSGFHYCEGSFLEKLQAVKPNEVVGIDKKRKEVRARGFIDLNSGTKMITLYDLNDISTLGIGDEVKVSVFVPFDTIVLGVDPIKGIVYVNNDLLRSGDTDLTFYVLMKTKVDEDPEDFWGYRMNLVKNGLYDRVNPFTHGLFNSQGWPDQVSMTPFNSQKDSNEYRQQLSDSLQDSDMRRRDFNEIVLRNYMESKDQVVMPSLIDEGVELFYEFQPTRVLEGQLSNVRMLDYFMDALWGLSRAGDFTEVGTHLVMQTDGSGRYTPFTGKLWTDDSIENRFRTFHWSDKVIPMYLEIGTGRLDHLFKVGKDADEIEEVDVSSARYYYEGGPETREDRDVRGAVYGEHQVEHGDVGMWGGEELAPIDPEDMDIVGIKHVQIPVMETPIGEYELQRFVSPLGGENASTYTLVNTTVRRQELSDLNYNRWFTMTTVDTSREDLLSSVSNSIHKDLSAKPERELFAPIDLLSLVFDGVFVPEPRYNAERDIYEVGWPEPARNDGRLHYLIVKKDVTLPQIYDSRDGYTKVDDFSFGKTDIIVWDGVKWVVKQFQCGGIWGDNVALYKSLTPEKDNQEILEIDLGVSNPPGPVIYDRKPDSSESSGSWTVRHRLLTKLLADYGVFKGNLLLARTFSPHDLTEISKWIFRGLCDDNVKEVSFELYEKEFDTVTDMINGYLDVNGTKPVLDSPYKSTMLPTDYRPYDIRQDRVYWFVLGPLALPPPNEEGDGWKSFKNLNIKPGTGFAITFYQNDDEALGGITGNDPSKLRRFHQGDWVVYSFATKYKLSFLVPYNSNIGSVEWMTLKGQNGMSLFPDEIGDTTEYKLWLPIQVKNDLFSHVQLSRSYINPGSMNMEMLIDPQFKSKAWTKEDYVKGRNDDEHEVLISVNNAIYDEAQMKVLTTTVDDVEYVIKQESNKFFKNVLFLVGNYTETEVQAQDSINVKHRMTMIPGVPFDMDQITTVDRVLSIETVKVRSQHTTDLEPNLYSSYAVVEPVFRGISKDPVLDEWVLHFSSELGPTIQEISNRLETVADLSKLVPVRNGADYADHLMFRYAKWSGDKIVIPSPTIKEAKFMKRISDDKNFTFQYYKNTLILEGIVDISQPHVIRFDQNLKLGDSLKKVLVGDSVLRIQSLTYSKYYGTSEIVLDMIESYTMKADGSGYEESNIVPSGPKDIKIVDWAEGWLVAILDDGTLLCSRKEEVPDMLQIPKVVKMSEYSSPSTNPIDTTKVTGLHWDTDVKKWFYSLSSDNGSSVIFEFDPVAHTIEESYQDAGVDVNTYQLIDVVDIDTGVPGENLPDTSQYAKTYARDVAFKSVETSIRQEKNFIGYWGLPVREDQRTGGTKVDVINEAPALNPIKTSQKFRVPSTFYEELSFTVYQNGASANNDSFLSLGVDMRTPNAAEAVKPEGWRFDRSITRWVPIDFELAVTPSQYNPDPKKELVPVLKDFKGTESAIVKTYLVGEEFARSNDEIKPIRDKPPRCPGKIPTIEFEGWDCRDDRFDGTYPVPPVPYGGKWMALSKSHPFREYLKKVIDNPDLENYVKDPETLFQFTNSDGKPAINAAEYIVQETQYINIVDGMNIWSSPSEYFNKNVATRSSLPMRKGQAIPINPEAEDLTIAEAHWWCLTNPRAPDKNAIDDYGRKIYVEEPPEVNREVTYQFSLNDKGEILKRPTSSSDTNRGVMRPDDDLDLSCEWKVMKVLEPPLKEPTQCEIPLEYQGIYPDVYSFYTEYLIYRVEYADYVNAYESYVASPEYKEYIAFLKKEWNYIGEADSSLLIEPGAASAPFVRSDGTVVGALAHGFINLEEVRDVPLFLRKLPPPITTPNVEVAAVICRENTDYALYIKKVGGGSFSVVDTKVSSPPTVVVDIGLDGIDKNVRNRVIGPYDPVSGTTSANYTSQTQLDRLMANKHTCWNSKGYVAVVLGDTVFFKSPTRVFDVVENVSIDPLKGTTVSYVSRNSQSFMWKRAYLPSSRHSEWASLQKLGLDQAKKFCTQIRYRFLILIETMMSGGTTSMDASLARIKEWVEANPIRGVKDDDLRNEYSSEYLDEDSIPTAITLNGVSFIETPSGIQAEFGNDLTYTFSAAAMDINGYQTRDNYYKYLNYYTTYILGNVSFDRYLDNGIKRVYMSDTNFHVLTMNDDLLTLPLSRTYCRDDIENYDNWYISNIDSRYTLTVKDGNDFVERSVIIDGETKKFSQWPQEKDTKGIHVEALFSKGDLVVVGGYVQANAMVEEVCSYQTTYSIYNNLYPNDSWRTFKVKDRFPKYPCLFYSTNGGRDFKRCDFLPTKFIPNLKSYNGEVIDPSGAVLKESENDDVFIRSLHLHGDEVHAWFGRWLRPAVLKPNGDMTEAEESGSDVSDFNVQLDWVPLGYTTVTEVGGWDEEIKTIEKKSQAQLAILKQIEAGVEGISVADYIKIPKPVEGSGEYTADDLMEFKLAKVMYPSYQSRSIIYPERESHHGITTRVIVQQPFSFLVENTKITEVFDQEVEVTRPSLVAPKNKAEDVRVLVSIVSTYDVPDQAQYLEYKDEYLSWTGAFLVPEHVDVDGPSEANKVYSYRETLRIRDPNQLDVIPPRDEEPKSGVPAVGEDLDHKIYLYDRYVDQNGTEVWAPIPEKNKNDSYVMLCDEEGSLLLERDTYRVKNSVSLFKRIEKGVLAQSLIKMTKVSPDIDITLDEPKITAALITDEKIEIVNLDVRLDSVKLTAITRDLTVIERLIEKVEEKPGDPDTLRSSFILWGDGTAPHPIGTEFQPGWDLVYYYLKSVSFNEGTPFEYNTSRVSPIEINGEWFLYDNETQIVPFYGTILSHLVIYLPYEAKAKQKEFFKAKMIVEERDDDRGVIESPNPDYSVTGVFLDPKGYGGLVNNESFETELPWSLDGEAFENDEYLINDKNDFVYLSDSSGHRIVSKNGLDRFYRGDEVVVREIDIFEKKHRVKVWVDDYLPYQYFLYNREYGKLDIRTLIRDEDEYEVIELHDKVSGKLSLTIGGLEVSFSDKNSDGSDKVLCSFKDDKGDPIDYLSIVDDKVVHDGSLDSDGMMKEPENGLVYLNVMYDTIRTEKELKIRDFNDEEEDEGGNDYQPYAFGHVVSQNVVSITKSTLTPITTTRIEIYLDPMTLQNGDLFVSNDTSVNLISGFNVNETEDMLRDRVNRGEMWQVAIIIDTDYNFPEIFLIGGRDGHDLKKKIQLFVYKTEEPELLVPRDTYFESSDLREIVSQSKVFIDAIDVTYRSPGDARFKIDPSGNQIIAVLGDLKLSFDLIEQPLKLIGLSWFIFLENEESVLTITEDCFIEGLTSNVILRPPKYDSFKKLLAERSNIIYAGGRLIGQYVKPTEFIQVYETDADYKYFDLDRPIEGFETGSHSILIRFLTLAHVSLPVTKMNEPRYIQEVTVLEKDNFGYDRIYFNDEAYYLPPVKILNKYYFGENKQYFKNEKLYDGGFKVYECDENGLYVRWVTLRGDPIRSVLGVNGDLSKDIFGSVDRRNNPLEPKFLSSYEWYINQFYVKGFPSNPFWQKISLSDVYDQASKSFIQEVMVLELEKSVGNMSWVEVELDDRMINIDNSVMMEVSPTNIVSEKIGYFNYRDGQVDFILEPPTLRYKKLEKILKYGIIVKNSFYPGEVLMEVWKNNVKVEMNTTYNFTVNTTESLKNLSSRDEAIVKITEMGLFDENHDMVAYAIFPPLEYRSDVQHSSWTLVIRNKSFPSM